MTKFFTYIALFSLLLLACKSKTVSQSIQETTANEVQQSGKTVVLKGFLLEQGVTTYQYGSHLLRMQDRFYALRSESVNLKAFVGKKVELKGVKIEGYPVDGGPEYVSVIQLKVVE